MTITEISETITLDPARQEKAREYARIRRRLLLVEIVLGGLYVLLWLWFGWASLIKQAMLNYTQDERLLLAGIAAVFAAIYLTLSLPLSYYAGYILPHRYDLSTQDLKDWIWDGVKGLFIVAPLGLALLEIVYAILRGYPDTWWLWAAAFMLVFNVLLANLFPVLIAPMFNKYIPLEKEHADLKQRLLQLAKKAATRVQGVYKFDMSRRTKAANAALVGIGNTRRIVLGDTLINKFNPDEIETVLAHELGHHVHRDLALMLLFDSILTLVGFYLASLGLQWGVDSFGFSHVADAEALPLFILVMAAYNLLIMPIENGFSRWRERLADRYALQATGKSKAYISALTRLANQNLAEIDPEPWVELLLYSHPSLHKRIKMAEEWDKSPLD